MHIFLISVCLDAKDYVGRCIESVKIQTHEDWSMLIVVDDSAEHEGARLTLEAAGKEAAGDKRIKVIGSPGRRYALRNRVEGIDRYCPHDAVVAKLDADDYLSDPGALAAISERYDRDPELDALWTQFVTDKGERGFCRDMPSEADAADYKWVTSHMQTFRKRLLWGVGREVFLENGDDWWKTATDQALYLPLLNLAKKRTFLNRVCYVYRTGVGTNKSDEQLEAERGIRRAVKKDKVGTSRNVLFLVSGPGHSPDRRFWQGERRAPIGILSMSAHLRARGHSVRLFDRFLDPSVFPPDQDLLDWADVVGVYVSTPNVKDGEWILGEVRRKGFKGNLLAGGPHSVLYPDQILGWGADFAATFESDFAISKLVENKLDLLPPKRLDYLDALPFPDYHLVRSQGIEYIDWWPFGPHKPVMNLNTSRGCPFNCAFCDQRAIWGRKWTGQSAERVVLDVDYIQREFGAAAVYFREDNFGCDPRRLVSFCESMKSRVESGVSPLYWACEVRADRGKDADLVKLMAEAGCRGFYVGAESGSDAMLKRMQKGITADQIEATCDNARAHGVHVALSLIDGFPGETEEDVKLTDALIERARPAHVWRNKYRRPVEVAPSPSERRSFDLEAPVIGGDYSGETFIEERGARNLAEMTAGVRLEEGHRVLEVSAAGPRMAEKIEAAHPGVETIVAMTSSSMLEYARNRSAFKGKLIPLNGARLSVAENRIDFAYSFSGLEFLGKEKAYQTLKDIKRALTPGGLLRFCVPDLSHPRVAGEMKEGQGGPDDFSAAHPAGCYLKEELEAWSRLLGFEEVEVSRFDPMEEMVGEPETPGHYLKVTWRKPGRGSAAAAGADDLKVSLIVVGAGDDHEAPALESMVAAKLPSSRFEMVWAGPRDKEPQIVSENGGIVAAPVGEDKAGHFGKMANEGARRSSGDLLVFIDYRLQDVRDLIGRVVALHSSDPRLTTARRASGKAATGSARSVSRRWFIETNGFSELPELSGSREAGLEFWQRLVNLGLNHKWVLAEADGDETGETGEGPDLVRDHYFEEFLGHVAASGSSRAARGLRSR